MKSLNCGLKTKDTLLITQLFEIKLNPPQNFAQYQTNRNGSIAEWVHICTGGRVALYEQKDLH
jgi:hypothetical protein